MAIQIITNILELKLDNPQLLRITAYKLDAEGYSTIARKLFEKVLIISPEEPQSYRDLALVCEKEKKYEKAIEYFIKVITGSWDSRFDEIELTAITELNALLQRLKYANVQLTKKMKKMLSVLPKRFLVPFQLDLRVTLGWDTDMVDIDLWVHEPNNTKCFYSNKSTKIGGQLTRDFTQGYGPEEYLLKRAIKGWYIIQANYFGKSNTKLSGTTSALLTFYTNFGRKNEKSTQLNIRLEEVKSTLDVGYIYIDF